MKFDLVEDVEGDVWRISDDRKRGSPRYTKEIFEHDEPRAGDFSHISSLQPKYRPTRLCLPKEFFS